MPRPALATLQPDHTPPANDTSILVVAGHALVRAGLRAILGSTPGLAVVAEAPDVGEATALAARHRPDVVLLDAPPASGAGDSIAALCNAAPGACLLCLGDDDADAAPIACVPRSAGVTELCDELDRLLGGKCTACVFRKSCQARRAQMLSPREKQVAVHVAAGLSSKQIAATLGIGLRTVNTYRESLARKLGASSPAVLTRFVMENGLEEELRSASA